MVLRDKELESAMKADALAMSDYLDVPDKKKKSKKVIVITIEEK